MKRVPVSRRDFLSCGMLMLAGGVGCTDVNLHAPEIWDPWDPEWPEARNRDFSAQATFSRRLDSAALTALSLTGVAGQVDIVSDESAEISIQGVRRVRSDSQLDADRSLARLDVEVSQSGPTLYVVTRQPRASDGRAYEVDYRIMVPHGFDLFAELVAGKIDAAVTMAENGVVDLTNVAGDIDLEVPVGTSASLRIDVVAGSIHVRDLVLDDKDPRAGVARGVLGSGDGSITLSTVAGDVTLKGRQGGAG